MHQRERPRFGQVRLTVAEFGYRGTMPQAQRPKVFLVLFVHKKNCFLPYFLMLAMMAADGFAGFGA